MTGRTLSTTVAAAISAEHVVRTSAIELNFPIGVVRFNASPSPIMIGADEFLGVGILGSIATAEESAELRSYGMTVKLSGIPRDMISVAFNEAYQGRRGTIWEVPLHRDTWQPLADPIVIFRGRMDQMNITLGQQAEVEVRLENRLADWERPRLSRYTDEDQRRLHGGDTGMRFVASTTEKDLIWPMGSWKPGGGPALGGGFGLFGR